MNGEIERLAKATVRELAIEAAESGDKDSLKWATGSHDYTRLRSMLALAQSECSVKQEAFDADPWILNCQSGAINLCSGRLHPHNPANLTRKLAPVEFDSAAKCPTFHGFLDRIFAGDAELIAFMQRAIGYSLTGRTDEQCLFVLVGSGANGKSTLIRVMQDLLGDYAQQTPMDALMSGKAGALPSDIARLEGARFVAAVEAEAGQKIAEAKIKQLTGGDRITARYMYAEFFEFTPQFKLWLATNRLPEVRGTDNGIWRRFHVIPFNVTIPEGERDGALPDKLKAELPGILKWAIGGCLEWQRGGLVPPGSVREATKAYRADMDVLMQFIEDQCVAERNAAITVASLYNAYVAWCNANAEQPTSKREFGRRLNDLGYADARTGLARQRRGIRLKTDAELLYGGLVLANDANDALAAE